jgi:exodeoxyribonuclease VII large subunit
LNAELDVLITSRYPSIVVEGEVAQLQQPASGHVYLVLRDKGGNRDQDCTLSAVVWRDDWSRLRYKPTPGERILCRGRLSVFQPKASVQLYVTDMAPAGQGALAKQLEERKARLLADGLLDPRRKRALPAFPRVVGVATSRSGAALQDFLKVSRERWPAARILVAGCVVQGPETPSSVIRAIELLLEDGRAEVIVVTRGGGSKEDLLPFHDEGLARFLAACPVPVVSAVGHQIDTTIADLVADQVAPTPSAAAMLVFPDRRVLAQRVDAAASALHRAISRLVRQLRERVDQRSRRLRHPGERVRDVRRRLGELQRRLDAVIARRLVIPRLQALEARLHALSPLAVLDRGYAIVTGPRGVVTVAGAVHAGDRVTVRVSDGAFAARVEPGVARDGEQLALPVGPRR